MPFIAVLFYVQSYVSKYKCRPETAKTADLHIFLKSQTNIIFLYIFNSDFFLSTLTRCEISISGSLFTLFCDRNIFFYILVKVFMLFNNFLDLMQL